MKSVLRPTKRRKDDYFLQTLGKVPMDMWTYIFHFLTNDEILSLRVLSKSWKHVVERSTIWEQRFMKMQSMVEQYLEKNEYFQFVNSFGLGHYDMENISGLNWARSLYYMNCFGLLDKFNFSCWNIFQNTNNINRFALFLSRNNQTQFLSHWMFAIYKCRLRKESVQRLSAYEYDNMCFKYFWELRDETTTVVLKDLTKFREQTIALEVTFNNGQRNDYLIVYHTNAKTWNFHFDKVEFDIREKRGDGFVTPDDAFVDFHVFAGLVATIKLYQSPFHQMGEESRAICTQLCCL